MRKTSGQLHIVDHSTEQIVAVLQPKDYRDDLRHWEIKNNIDRLEFKVFTSLPAAATLMQQNLILRETRDGRIIPYTIDEAIQTTDKRSIHVYASAVWVEIAQANYIRPQKIQSKTVNEFMDMALAGTKWKRGFTEYSGFHTMTIDTFIDPLKFLKDIASLFHLEIQYRVEVRGSQIVGWYVDMIQRRGKDEGKEITLGKDLIGIKRIENTRNICTALVGFVKGEGDSVITIESINKGLPYIVDTQAFQLWNKQGFHRFGLYTPETENQNMTPQRLKTLMEIEIKKRRNAAVTYEVEAQSINRVFGFDHESIFEGDTIRIKDKGFTPKLYLEARAIAGDESYKNPLQDRYMFGDYREIVDPNEELRKIYNRILSSLGNKQEMIDQLDKLVKEANETASNAKIESEAAKTLAEKVQENIKNNTVEIIESKYPPTTGLKDRKTLWLDISNGKPGILKLWKDGIWDPVVPDVESVKKETLEQVNKDIESTKTELNQKVKTVESKAQEIAGQIVDVQKQVNNKVDQTWIDNQLKDKADKSGVYTKDEIKDGFIGKQVYETDKLGNVKKFQDINTSIGQTNEALTQKAEKSELKKTNEGLSQLEQKTNEIKTTAEGTKQTLTELQTKVDNTKITVRNIIRNSGDFEKGWGIFQNISTIEVIDDNKFGKVLEAISDSLTTSRNPAIASIPFNVEPGKEYLLTFWIKRETKGVISQLLKFIDSDGRESNPIVGRDTNIEAQTWYYYKQSFVVPNGIKKAYITPRIITSEASKKFWIAHPMLREGNTDTGWQPAPEDNISSTDFTKKTVEIENTIKGINITVSNVQNEQGKLTERIAKSEQTADGFKTSIESLTKKDTEISNKLNTVESTVEGTKKTISEVQQTTNDLKKTTTEIKEQAGKISEKLTSVETKVGNTKINVRNLIRNSGDFAKGWGVFQNISNLSVVGDTKFSKALQAIADNSTSNRWPAMSSPIFAVSEDKEYILTMWIKRETAGVIGQLLKFIDSSGNQSNPITGKDTEIPANTWHYYTQAFKAPKGAVQAYITPRIGTSIPNIKFWIAQPMLIEGNTDIGWQPAPEDQVTTDEFTKKTTEIEKSVDGVKTSVTNVQNSQAGFEKRMSTVEQTATGLSSTVSNLNNVVSDQGKKLTEANTKIEQQATAINAKVELKQVEDYVAGFKIPELKQTVNQNKELLLDELANKLATEQFNQKMTLIDNRFTINEQGINAAAKRTEVYTRIQADGQFAKDSYVRDLEGRIQITEKNILSTVKKGDIISSINQSAEKIKISAALIDLVGKVEASWLKAGLLIGMTIKTSNSTEHLHMENQVVRFVNQGSDKMVIGFENERKSKTRNPYIILGEGDGSGKNFGSIYKDGNGVYYRYVDLNGAESNIRLTNAGNIGITAQDGFWVNSKRANFNSTIEVPAIRFTSLGTTPGSQQGNFWIGNGYKGFGIYYYDNYWKFVQGS